MSQRDRDRLVVLRQVDQGVLTVSEGARRAGLSLRQFRRLVRRFEGEGDRAVVHRARGRRTNSAVTPEVRQRALAKVAEPLYADFGPTLLSEHLARDPAMGAIHRNTLRQRERRAAPGELVLMDTSEHAWLEDRSAEEIALIAMIDDATSRRRARFVPRDTGAANRQMLVDYLWAQGRMGALYGDRASHFPAHFRARERRERDQAEALTLIRRALDALDIELILALSPQAKGRVERLFKTLQDRLIEELRVRGIATLAARMRSWSRSSSPSGTSALRSRPASRSMPTGRCPRAWTCCGSSPRSTPASSGATSPSATSARATKSKRKPRAPCRSVRSSSSAGSTAPRASAGGSATWPPPSSLVRRLPRRGRSRRPASASLRPRPRAPAAHPGGPSLAALPTA